MNRLEYEKVTSQLIRRSFFTVMAWIAPTAPIAGYLVGLSLGLPADDTLWAVTRILPPVFVLGGIVLPWWGLSVLIRQGLREVPGEPPEKRLERLLRLPWKLATVGVNAPYLFGGVFFGSPVVILFNKGPMLEALALLIAISFGVVLSIPVGMAMEEMLLPYTLEARNQAQKWVEGHGFFWPKQRWYLPYVFATSLATTLALAGVVVVLQANGARDKQVQALHKDKTLTEEQATMVARRVSEFSDTLLDSVGPPLAALGLFTLLVPSLSAWMLARRQARAAAAVREAIEGLATGKPIAPKWASTDEFGDLAAGMVAVLERLREIPSTLESSANRLQHAGSELSSASNEQRQSLSQQAAAIQEAHVTSQEIRQTSSLAAQKAESVLVVATRAEKLGESGEAALNQTFSGLTAIREFVDSVRGTVGELDERAKQLGNIVTTVKSLADRSNMLALNAAIEAVRSGEHGKGFAVVAREIRALADQSIKETVRIRDLLEDITSAVRAVVARSEQGALQVEGGLQKVKTSGESLKELVSIIQENSAAVRQIAAAVNQQNAGVSQMFVAIAELSHSMDETVKRLDTTLAAAQTLDEVTREVTEIANRYQVKD